ncbi:hypothetical protein BC938DRAFT_482402 [Jimgerdemannia flammicorona]|uniref:Armadillo-type protein n=1 Tax=Jimgerdemannia flammicorona TaxID=994334 RepID=A0A433QE86_9FUNG|nr:hypothetical protein BC938DRAFT_482402 [Jimgerdemannia flammicorona]
MFKIVSNTLPSPLPPPHATDIQNMKLWPSILSLLSSPEPSLRKGAAWVCGTALQNNIKAQRAFLDNDGLRHVLTLLRDDPDKGVRSKAQYAVSGAIKHFPEALEAFAGMGGYDVLGEVITRADDPPTLRKIIFLYNTLMAEDPATAPVLRDNGTVAKLEEVLGKFGEDEDMVEKTVRTLHTLLTQTSTPAPATLAASLRTLKAQHGDLGLTEKEWREFGV